MRGSLADLLGSTDFYRNVGEFKPDDCDAH